MDYYQIIGEVPACWKVLKLMLNWLGASYTSKDTPWIYATVPHMVTDCNAQGMKVGHVKDLRNCHGSTTDRHGQVCG